MARIRLKILNIKSAKKLSQVAIALGSARNIASLRVLALEGIQEVYTALNSQTIAKFAGIHYDLIEKITTKFVEDKKIKIDYAKEILQKMIDDENL